MNLLIISYAALLEKAEFDNKSTLYFLNFVIAMIFNIAFAIFLILAANQQIYINFINYLAFSVFIAALILFYVKRGDLLNLIHTNNLLQIAAHKNIELYIHALAVFITVAGYYNLGKNDNYIQLMVVPILAYHLFNIISDEVKSMSCSKKSQ